jgi:CheY-like chemotaxis protein
MPEGGQLTIETTTVSLDSESARRLQIQPGRYVLLTVSDNGSGIDRETCQRIFEPFFTTKGPDNGTGLGLATIHGFVKQSAGAITVSSELGAGTTFRIYLPQAEAAAGENLADEGPPPRGTPGSETILVVEDNDLILVLAREALTAAGYIVIEAAHPEAARKLVEGRADQINLLVTDVVMPGMSGPELARHLREQTPSLRVLYTSGYTQGKLESELNSLSSTFLKKPYGPRELRAEVRAILDTPADQAA